MAWPYPTKVTNYYFVNAAYYVIVTDRVA